MTRIMVTSARGANGDGYGALLCFSADGLLAGPFIDDRRIIDPRGLSLSPGGDLVYVTSGDDRVVALDHDGTVVLDSGRTEGLDPGGGTFAPDGRYCVTLRRHTHVRQALRELSIASCVELARVAMEQAAGGASQGNYPLCRCQRPPRPA